MSLATLDLNRLREQMDRAVQQESPLIDNLRTRVRNLAVRDLGYRQMYAIAPVATDGGDNRISFEPLNIEIVRVVDSEGKEHIQTLLPLSRGLAGIAEMFSENPTLASFVDSLGATNLSSLSYLLPEEGSEEWATPDPTRLRGYVRTFRDIVEWAVLLHLAREPGPPRLLIRDGLLRTKALRSDMVGRLAELFRQEHDRNGSLLVGVAKHSQVLNYLSLALTLEGTFKRSYPCYCEVPKEIEQQAYSGHAWLTGSCFGQLHLAKLTDDPGGLVLPVDLPAWLLPRRKEVLEYLVHVSRDAFPQVGYPYPLVKAHENAVLRGLEMTILGDMLIGALVRRANDEEAELIMRHVNIGRALLKGGTRD